MNKNYQNMCRDFKQKITQKHNKYELNYFKPMPKVKFLKKS